MFIGYVLGYWWNMNGIHNQYRHIYIYIYISGQIITTSLFSLTGIMVSKRNHPKMAQHFRLVKYYNLPIYIYTYWIGQVIGTSLRCPQPWPFSMLAGNHLMTFLFYVFMYMEVS